MNDTTLIDEVFDYLEKDSLIHLSNVHKRRKLYGEVINLIQKQPANEWVSVAGVIKNMITEFDHVNDEPIKVLDNINNVLDDAFAGGFPPDTIKERCK